MTRKTLPDFYRMKTHGEKIAFLTCYDFPTAQLAEAAGIDMLLVGDSLGMCVYGYDTTYPVTMEQMIVHAQAVRRGAPNTFLVGDMPFMSYQPSDEEAIRQAGRFLKEAGCDAVKLEGGTRMAPRIRALVEAGLLVMGHIGLTPQAAGPLGGYKAQGRSAESACRLLDDALAVQEAGAQMLLIEAVPPEVGGAIAARMNLPVLSIGAGPAADGQLLIVSDLIGLFGGFTPKFVKRYADVAGAIRGAVTAYVSDVKAGRFPEAGHAYTMNPDEKARWEAALARLSHSP